MFLLPPLLLTTGFNPALSMFQLDDSHGDRLPASLCSGYAGVSAGLVCELTIADSDGFRVWDGLVLRVTFTDADDVSHLMLHSK